VDYLRIEHHRDRRICLDRKFYIWSFYMLNSLLLSSQSSHLINYLSLFVMIYLISTTIAVKGLIDSVRVVIKYVNDKNLEGARRELSHIVGRDTENSMKEVSLRQLSKAFLRMLLMA